MFTCHQALVWYRSLLIVLILFIVLILWCPPSAAEAAFAPAGTGHVKWAQEGASRASTAEEQESSGSQKSPQFPGLVGSEFLFEAAPFPSCHASTICETEQGLIAAWFGGSEEGAADVRIWSSRQVDGRWTKPLPVADGLPDDGPALPCWNPVLFQVPGGPLLLFYKIGPSPSNWWGMVKRSLDAGASWSDPERLPDGYLGPIKNKPIWLNQRLLAGSSTEDGEWRVHFERASADLAEWTNLALRRQQGNFNIIQPTLLRGKDGRILALCRSADGFIVETSSEDGGETWSQLRATSLPNPNSGIDGVTLQDGRQLLVYNHTSKEAGSPRGREMLNLALSPNGEEWLAAAALERGTGEFSYPAVIQTRDGLVHLTYTHQRTRIKHLVIDPEKLVLQPLEQGQWPAELR